MRKMASPQVVPRTTRQRPDRSVVHVTGDMAPTSTHVFSRDLPSGLLLVKLLTDTRWDTDNDVRLDSSERGDGRCSGLGRKGTDGNGERRVERSVTVVSELSVVKITLENDQVGFRKVLE